MSDPSEIQLLIEGWTKQRLSEYRKGNVAYGFAVGAASTAVAGMISIVLYGEVINRKAFDSLPGIDSDSRQLTSSIEENVAEVSKDQSFDEFMRRIENKRIEKGQHQPAKVDNYSRDSQDYNEKDSARSVDPKKVPEIEAKIRDTELLLKPIEVELQKDGRLTDSCREKFKKMAA